MGNAIIVPEILFWSVQKLIIRIILSQRSLNDGDDRNGRRSVQNENRNQVLLVLIFRLAEIYVLLLVEI